MKKKLLSFMFLALGAFFLVGCVATTTTSKEATSNNSTTNASDSSTNASNSVSDENASTTDDVQPSGYTGDPLKDAFEREDFTSVYDEIGANITIDMVEEDEDGFAYVTYEGVKYQLGMDFLSMAMVYNCTPAGEFDTDEKVYNEWYRYFLQRWNYLVPEIPLYSNQYFDVYNNKIQNFVTSPYWSASDAIIKATVKEGETNSVILGNGTDLTGAFRSSSWGKSSPAASDQDIEKLTSGYGTLMSDIDGAYDYNLYDETTGYGVLKSEPTSTINEDGSITFTLEVVPGLKFSDGTTMNAKNFIAGLLMNSTAVGEAAGGSGKGGLQVVGFDEFAAYNGTGDPVYFEGVKLYADNEYKWSVTYVADYAGYYYGYLQASFSPSPLALWLGNTNPESMIVTDEEGHAGLAPAFYAQNSDKDYLVALDVKENLKWNSNLPYSGPYKVTNYDESTKTATLSLNDQYPGDKFRGKASIATITYIKTESETQTSKLQAHELDVLEGITGGDETKSALALVNDAANGLAETHYDRAGYGKLGFRCDYAATSFTEVRQAIMYTINRPEFAQTFTGGYGTVVHGPYYEALPAYAANKAAGNIALNPYTYSTNSANEVLDEAGWVYNADGTAYNGTGIRYKKLEGSEMTYENLTFKTTDNKYKTEFVNGNYYLPLAINWFGTQPNTVTDLLITSWQTSKAATESIGMYITYTSSDFATALYGELMRIEGYGYTGSPRLNAVNFATGFNSAVYDVSYYWTINPDYYDNYSDAYLMDEADFYANYQSK